MTALESREGWVQITCNQWRVRCSFCRELIPLGAQCWKRFEPSEMECDSCRQQAWEKTK